MDEQELILQKIIKSLNVVRDSEFDQLRNTPFLWDMDFANILNFFPDILKT